jgi:hypothetical protein
MKSIKYILPLLLLMPTITMGAVIFEDDFSAYDNQGWYPGTTSSFNTSNPPSGWTAYKRPSNSVVQIDPGTGQHGTPALKLGYQITGASSALSLGKHLTGNQNTGYDELYIRYQVKFDDNFKVASNGHNVGAWKWMRLWQYRDPNDRSDWSETPSDVEDTRYIVAALNDVSGVDRPGWKAMWSDNQHGHSNGGPRVQIEWYPWKAGNDQGTFEAIPNWELNYPPSPNAGMFKTFDGPGSQEWHTVEFHIKLSTIGPPGNGLFEIWMDGIRQVKHSKPSTAGGMSGNWENPPTQKYQGGINWITVFDNNQAWSASWNSPPGTPGHRYIYLDNIVVSTSYIGNSYVVGGASPPDNMPPAPPLNLR